MVKPTRCRRVCVFISAVTTDGTNHCNSVSLLVGAMEELERLERCRREPEECPGADDDLPEDIDSLRRRVQQLQRNRNDLQQKVKESRQVFLPLRSL